MSKISSFNFDLCAHAKYNASHAAFVDTKAGVICSYRELYSLSIQIHELMTALGLQLGDVVLSPLPNSLPHMLFFIGLTSSGFSFAPLCSESTLSEIEKAVEILEPNLILIPPFLPLSHKTALEKKPLFMWLMILRP